MSEDMGDEFADEEDHEYCGQMPNIVMMRYIKEATEQRAKTNGILEVMQGTMTRVEGKVDGMEGKVDRLEGKVDRLEGKVDGMEGKVDGMETLNIKNGKCCML